MLMLGFMIMYANGVLRFQKDLFLDDQELANSGFLSILSSVASSTTARVRPTPLICLRPLLFRLSDAFLFRQLDPRRHCPLHQSPALWLMIFNFVCDWWFCLVWIEEKDWRFGLVVFFFFFFLLWTGDGCGWCCGCFLGSGVYYFIVVDILFYYNVYIILLCWKLK